MTRSRRGAQVRDLAHAVAALVLGGVLVGACGGSPASSGPVGSAPSTEPSQAVTASPRPAGQQVIDAFLAVTQAEDRSMHMELSGQVVIAGLDPQKLTAAYDIQGPDFAGVTTIESPMFGSLKTQVIVVNGQTFTNTLDRGWGGESTSRPAQDPFTGLKPADVAYVGPETVAGGPGHRLRMHDPVGAFVRAMGASASVGFTDIVVKSASYDVLVDAAGRPLSAAFTLEATTREAGDMTVSMSYAFSEWGSRFAIVAPIDLPPSAPPGAVLTVYNRYTEAIVLRDTSGHELAVPACSSASATAFDVEQFEIRSIGGDILGVEYPNPDRGWKIKFLAIGPGYRSIGPDPVLGELQPCADRSTAP